MALDCRRRRAEQKFAATYPSLHAHLKPFEAPLVKRQDKGRFWWELGSCAYWDKFDAPSERSCLSAACPTW